MWAELEANIISHDFKCPKCSYTFEVTFDSGFDFRRDWPCSNCGGSAIQIWLRAPGLAGVMEPGTRGVARSFEPGWDVQSGRYFNDRAERDRYCKERGIELMGAQEHKRSMLAEKTPEPDWSGLPDAMEKAYHEVKQGRREKPAKLDDGIPLMEAKND